MDRLKSAHVKMNKLTSCVRTVCSELLVEVWICLQLVTNLIAYKVVSMKLIYSHDMTMLQSCVVNFATILSLQQVCTRVVGTTL